MSKIDDLHEKWLGDSDYRDAWQALDSEYALAHAMIEARSRAELSQSQLAERMKTTQSVIARLESGRVRPSTRTLQRLAEATRTRLQIRFIPDEDAA
ncbi:helix-turn-helix domain-containing protein [Fodinicurvata fenggangensis]|uniref:helix-turn-helix domain-containing protein n=1 Tax=Fodinicurvata fenggangensis TaxID=1121830 RepID=UPI00047D28CB|nr:helix-turn-helix transcriptional regulator [Fodinicurvata fenggangensis]